MKFYTYALGFGDKRFECIALACITCQCQRDWITSMRVSILISKRFSSNISIDVCAYLFKAPYVSNNVCWIEFFVTAVYHTGCCCHFTLNDFNKIIVVVIISNFQDISFLFQRTSENVRIQLILSWHASFRALQTSKSPFTVIHLITSIEMLSFFFFHSEPCGYDDTLINLKVCNWNESFCHGNRTTLSCVFCHFFGCYVSSVFESTQLAASSS